jgi:hypothetical protein
MKKFVLVIAPLLILGLLVMFTARADAILIEPPDPFVNFQIGDDSYSLDLQTILGDDEKEVYAFEFEIEKPGEYLVSGGGYFDPDPIISYGISVTNFTGGLKPYTFNFGTPIILPPGPTSVTSSLSYSLTDTTGNGIQLLPINPFVQQNDVAAPLTNMGVDLDPAGFIAGPTGIPTSYISAGAFNIGPVPGPVQGTFNTMTITTSFQLSGIGDIAVVTGSASINHIPEPCTMFLLCSGLLGLVGLKRKKLF